MPMNGMAGTPMVVFPSSMINSPMVVIRVIAKAATTRRCVETCCLTDVSFKPCQLQIFETQSATRSSRPKFRMSIAMEYISVDLTNILRYRSIALCGQVVPHSVNIAYLEDTPSERNNTGVRRNTNHVSLDNILGNDQ